MFITSSPGINAIQAGFRVHSREGSRYSVQASDPLNSLAEVVEAPPYLSGGPASVQTGGIDDIKHIKYPAISPACKLSDIAIGEPPKTYPRTKFRLTLHYQESKLRTHNSLGAIIFGC